MTRKEISWEEREKLRLANARRIIEKAKKVKLVSVKDEVYVATTIGAFPESEISSLRRSVSVYGSATSRGEVATLIPTLPWWKKLVHPFLYYDLVPDAIGIIKKDLIQEAERKVPRRGSAGTIHF